MYEDGTTNLHPNPTFDPQLLELFLRRKPRDGATMWRANQCGTTSEIEFKEAGGCSRLTYGQGNKAGAKLFGLRQVRLRT